MGIIDKAKAEIERLGAEAKSIVEGELVHGRVGKLLADLVALVESLVKGGEAEIGEATDLGGQPTQAPEGPSLPPASTMPIPVLTKAP